MQEVQAFARASEIARRILLMYCADFQIVYIYIYIYLYIFIQLLKYTYSFNDFARGTESTCREIGLDRPL